VSDDPDGFTWEAIIRAVTMAGRPDRIFELQLAWNKYFQILDAASKTLRQLRSRLGDKDWSGPGADAYRSHYDSLVKAIDDYYAKTSSLIEIAGDTGGALASAIANIPLPDMPNADVDALGMHGIHYSDAESGNQVQYEFFRTHRDRYADHGFRQYLYDSNGISADGSGHAAGKVPNDPLGAKKNKIDTWYATGTHRARAAFRDLLGAYHEQTTAIPTDSLRTVETLPTFDGGSDGSGGSEVSGSGSGAFTSGGASIGAPPPPAHPDGHQGEAGPTWSEMSNTSGTGDSSAWKDPQGSLLAGHTGGPGPVTPGTGNGVGAGTGGIGGDVAGGQVPAGGFGAPTMPGVGAPAGGKGAGGGVAAGDVAASGRSNTYGAIPAGNTGTGRKDRDERYSWLTEDDEDVWRPKNLAPKTNSAGAIE